MRSVSTSVYSRVKKVQLKIEIKGLDKFKREMQESPNAVRRATVSALNKLAQQGMNTGSRKLREEYNLKAGDIKKRVQIEKAKPNQLISIIVSRGSRRTPILYYGARQTKKGLSVSIKKGSRKVITHGFISTMKSGHTGGFIRRGKTRLPIDELYGPSVTHLFGSKKIQETIMRHIEDNESRIFESELRYFLDKVK